KRRVQTMLEMVHMLEHAPKKPNQLSGGQQQRVALARALVNYPSALLLDEPLSALDVKLRRAMQLELKKIQAEVQTTFIFVTHDQEEALTMSTRIAVMNAGRIEQLGSPETIYHQPATSFVANFIGETNLIGCTIRHQRRNETAVTLPDGTTVALSSKAPTAKGDTPAQLLLRPEHAQISPGHRPDWDFALKLDILSCSFRGSSLHVDVLTPWKQILQLQVPPKTSSADAITDKTSVFVHWPTEARWLVVGT
ncbi:MAG TPA: ABC transporter ATP-binding protein, partial [Gammaproteobacteria bacterium]|nr:ABC transporter ATP-binding protein [Gammaproteobacteria bacterium]